MFSLVGRLPFFFFLVAQIYSWAAKDVMVMNQREIDHKESRVRSVRGLKKQAGLLFSVVYMSRPLSWPSSEEEDKQGEECVRSGRSFRHRSLSRRKNSAFPSASQGTSVSQRRIAGEDCGYEDTRFQPTQPDAHCKRMGYDRVCE